jgi:hypothetical protein
LEKNITGKSGSYKMNLLKSIQLKYLLNKKIGIEHIGKYLRIRFSQLFPHLMYEGFGDVESNQMDILYEMENYGLEKISDFDKIIPFDYVIKAKQINLKLNYIGIIRTILIINDPIKYFENYLAFRYDNFWDIACLTDNSEIYTMYNIPVEELIRTVTQPKQANGNDITRMNN